ADVGLRRGAGDDHPRHAFHYRGRVPLGSRGGAGGAARAHNRGHRNAIRTSAHARPSAHGRLPGYARAAAFEPDGRSLMRTDRLIRVALPTGTVIAFLLIWTLYVRTAEVSAFILPTPWQIIMAFVDLVSDVSVWRHALVTVTEAVSGFFIAVFLGVTLGMAMARVQML